MRFVFRWFLRLSRIFFIPKSLVLFFLLFFDFRGSDSCYKRVFPNTFHPLQKKIESELSGLRSYGSKFFLNDLSEFSVVDNVYSEWNDIIILFDNGFFSLLSKYVSSNYFLQKRSNLGLFRAKCKVVEFYALYLSMKKGYVCDLSSFDSPVLFVHNTNCLIIDGAHRLSLAIHFGYDIPIVYFDYFSSIDIVSDESKFIINDIVNSWVK